MNQTHDYSNWLTQSENQKLTSSIQLKNGNVTFSLLVKCLNL